MQLSTISHSCSHWYYTCCLGLLVVAVAAASQHLLLYAEAGGAVQVWGRDMCPHTSCQQTSSVTCNPCVNSLDAAHQHFKKDTCTAPLSYDTSHCVGQSILENLVLMGNPCSQLVACSLIAWDLLETQTDVLLLQRALPCWQSVLLPTHCPAAIKLWLECFTFENREFVCYCLSTKGSILLVFQCENIKYIGPPRSEHASAVCCPQHHV